jgi:hypothetical protein
MKSVFNPETDNFSHVEMTQREYQDLGNDYGGICVACGDPTEGGIEPDARRYSCDSCDKRAVYGIEELMLRGRVQIVEVAP